MQNLSYNNFCLTKQKLLMAGPELPSNFDVIVIGTGLEESIVAAAAARNGHSVLHVDVNDFYGSQWSAFTLDGLQKWAKENESPQSDVRLRSTDEKSVQNDAILSSTDESSSQKDAISSSSDANPSFDGDASSDANSFLKDGESIVPFDKCNSSFKNVKQKWFVPEKHEPEKEKIETEKKKETKESETPKEEDIEAKNVDESGVAESQETKEEEEKEQLPKVPKSTKPQIDQATILSQSKRYSLDLMPHLLFARGSMVELLIKSNISRYTEFKAVTRVLTVLNGVLEHVPSSRSDVFSTKHISVIEKRILMKFINFCVNYEAHPEAYAAFREKTFHDFLRHEKLTQNLIHFVLHSIAMVDKHTGCLEGLASTQKFLLSLGRFGNTPFLWPMYGSGELPQAFCRLCAVFGGVYYLDRPIEAFVVKDGVVVAIVTKGQRIDCKYLVANSQLCPDSLKGERKTETVSRKICLLSESVMPAENGEQLSFLSLAPNVTETDDFAFLQEVGYGGAACPKGVVCLHLTTKGSGEENLGLEKCLDVLVPDKSKLIWSIDFEISTEIFVDLESSSKLINLFLTSGPVFELDFDSTIERAKNLFRFLFPEEDFLPRAPDPEEIIIGGDDDSANQDAGNEETNSEEVSKKDPIMTESGNPEVSNEDQKEIAPESEVTKEEKEHSLSPR